MRRLHVRLITGWAAAVLLGGACRTAPRVEPGLPTAADADGAAVERARTDSLRYPYTQADIHFMSAMIGHHAQAIRMSRMAPDRGASGSIRTLAERIINAQQDEIALMQQWLRDRRQAVPQPDTGGTATHGDHPISVHAMPGHAMEMPGMLTEAQFQQLGAARGPAFDRLFLEFMIQHHRGAIEMVRTLFATPGAAQDLTVFKVAHDVNVDQETEVARMSQMLATLLFGRPPS